MRAGRITRMLSVTLLIIALAAVFLGFYQSGTWRQRARSAEQQNDANRRAHEIQNDVAGDSVYRERVRREFDRP